MFKLRSFMSVGKSVFQSAHLVTLLFRWRLSAVGSGTIGGDNAGDNVETGVLGEARQRAPLGALTASTGSHQNARVVICTRTAPLGCIQYQLGGDLILNLYTLHHRVRAINLAIILSASKYFRYVDFPLIFSQQGLYFHHTKSQPPLRPPSTFSEN